MDILNEKGRYDLFVLKKNILAEITRLTRYAPIHPAEGAKSHELDAACEEISDLYEKRAALFTQIGEIDKKLGAASTENERAIAAEISETAKGLWELDKQNEGLFERLQSHVRDSLKALNKGKRALVYTE